MTEAGENLLARTKDSFRHINWWLTLIPVAGLAVFVAMFWVEIAVRPQPSPGHPHPTVVPIVNPAVPDKDHNDRYYDPFFYSLQDYLDRDYVAPVIVGLAALAYLCAAGKHRSGLFLLLGLLAVNFTFRELRDNPGLEKGFGWLCQQIGVAHTDKTWEKFMSRGVYVFAGGLLAAGIILFPRMERAMRADWRHTSWMFAIIAAYAVSLIVQRRAFRWWGPWEQHVHRSLEECTEDVAHAVFVVAGLMALRFRKQTPSDQLS